MVDCGILLNKPFWQICGLLCFAQVPIPATGRPSERPLPQKVYSSNPAFHTPQRSSSYSPQPASSTNSPQYPSPNSPKSPAAQLRLNSQQHAICQSKSWQEERRRGSNDSSGSSTKVTFSLGDNPINKPTNDSNHGHHNKPDSRPDSGVDMVSASPDRADMASGPWTVVDRSRPAAQPVSYRPRANTGNTYRPRGSYRGGRGHSHRNYYRGGGASR